MRLVSLWLNRWYGGPALESLDPDLGYVLAHHLVIDAQLGIGTDYTVPGASRAPVPITALRARRASCRLYRTGLLPRAPVLI
jgi:hypothetical protein